jgi:hypothetical protein
MDAGEFGRVVSAGRGTSWYGWVNFENHYNNQEVFINSINWGSRGVGGMYSGDGSKIDVARFISEGGGRGIRVNLIDRQVNHSFSAKDSGFGKTMWVDAGRVDMQGRMVNAGRGREVDLGLGLSAFHKNSDITGRGASIRASKGASGIVGKGASGIAGRRAGWDNVGDEIGNMQFASAVVMDCWGLLGGLLQGVEHGMDLGKEIGLYSGGRGQCIAGRPIGGGKCNASKPDSGGQCNEGKVV